MGLTKSREQHARSGSRDMGVPDGASPGSGSDRVLTFLVGFLAGVQILPLPLNLAFVDPILLYIIVYALTRRGAANELGRLRRCLPWLWVIVLGSLCGTFAAASVENSLVQLLRDLYAFSILLSMYVWFRSKPYVLRPAVYGLVLSGCVCAALIVGAADVRPAGTFQNPNYAAHYLVAVLVTLIVVRRAVNRIVVIVAVPLFAYAILLTGSFGALSMIAVAISAWLWGLGESSTPGRRWLGRLILVLTVFFVVLTGAIGTVSSSEEAESTGLGAERFVHSSDTRWMIWKTGLSYLPEHPFGVGPGSVRAESLALRDHELHNDVIAYLVERGPIGLVGLLGLWAAIWSAGRRGGPTRLLLLMFIVGSLTRETQNYRHLWITLALALYWEYAIVEPLATDVRTGPTQGRQLTRSESTRT